MGAEYDAMVLDVMMPKKDGYTLVEELREKEVSIPVLFLTARDSVADRVTGLDLSLIHILKDCSVTVGGDIKAEGTGKGIGIAVGLVGAVMNSRSMNESMEISGNTIKVNGDIWGEGVSGNYIIGLIGGQLKFGTYKPDKLIIENKDVYKRQVYMRSMVSRKSHHLMMYINHSKMDKIVLWRF